jgi:hypothetical protein
MPLGPAGEEEEEPAGAELREAEIENSQGRIFLHFQISKAFMVWKI